MVEQRRVPWWFVVAVLGLFAGAMVTAACQGRWLDKRDQGTAPPQPSRDGGAASTDEGDQRADEQAMPLPEMADEPQIRLLLCEEPAPTMSILAPCYWQGRGAAVRRLLLTGPIDARTLVPDDGDRGRLWVADRMTAFLRMTLRHSGRADSETLDIAGSVLVERDGANIRVVEELGLERYCASVVGREMYRDWPAAALQAQAVAARSYAVDRWMRRQDANWHLHWSYMVDMAYAGADIARRVDEAVQATRGRILQVGDLPLPALFCASSGGWFADGGAVFPTRRAADGVTAYDELLPGGPDPYAAIGAERLGREAGWRYTLSMAQIAERLRMAPSLRDARSIEAVLAIEPDPVADGRRRPEGVTITLRRHGEVETIRMAAQDFRLAMGPGEVRSTLWTEWRRVGDRLVIGGDGFGHGVGLSQISAYGMAEAGMDMEAILRHCYPRAHLQQRW